MQISIRENEDVIRVTLHEEGLLYGALVALATPRNCIRAQSQDDFWKVQEDTGAKNLYMYRVLSSEIVSSYQRKGFGTMMYKALAYYAREKYDAIIAADRCFGGTTSGQAERVWQRLSTDLSVSGLVAGAFSNGS